MKAFRLLSLVVPTLVASIACTGASPRQTTPVPIAHGAEVCKFDGAVCEKLCANCTDKKACFENGGECRAVGDFFKDNDDTGVDIWTPGCHHDYGDAACTPPGAFLNGDRCLATNPLLLIEWTNTICHPAQGDAEIFDCDQECLRAGRGNGRCTPDPNACAGNGSARCTCDHPAPTP